MYITAASKNPANIYHRYSTLQMRSTLSQIPDFHWCLNTTCTSGQIHTQDSSNPILTCFSCGYKTCATHNVKWHQNETCEQYDYRISGRRARDEEQANERIIKRTTKNCPGCKANIEKIDGCDHMTCKCFYPDVRRRFTNRGRCKL